MEKGFVYLDEMLHGIRWDAKYATWDNFTGKPVDGYEANRIVGTFELADALSKAMKQAASQGYGLLLWDGYRPQRAVNSFVKWCTQPEDGLSKSRYYPNIERTEIIEKGYVLPESSHTRGSAIDLTLYRLDTGMVIPMGGGFDLMDEHSHYSAKGVSDREAQNRRMLRVIMEDSGFIPYDCEWWHFVLKDEPYPGKYFDFPVA